MCDTSNRPVRNATLLITRHWGTAIVCGDRAHQTLKTMPGGPGVIWGQIIVSPYMHYTPSRPVRNTTLLPTGHWGMAAFDSNMGHVKHIEHWKPCLGVLVCYLGTNNRLLIYALCVTLPTGQWGTPHYSQPATEERQLYGVLGHIKHWKQCLGALMCHLGTNNPFLIHASCGILPTGQWGTPITPNRPLSNGGCMGR